MCRVQKAPHAKVKEKVGEKNLDARGKDDKILGGQQHKAKRRADEANAQPPQGTTAVNGEIEPVGSKPEKKKEKTAKGEQEPKGSPGRLPQENATIVLQDTKKRKAHVKEGQKHKKGRHRKRSKVTQGSAVALDAMDKKSSQQPEAAAPPGQQIASSQACGDGPAKEPTVPTTTTSLPPATAVGGNVEINADKTPSTITSVSQQSKTSVGGTPTLPWEGIDKEAETTYARGAQKVPSDENKGAGDGKSSHLLGANEMEQRKSDGTEEGERRRKDADKDAMVVRKQIVTTRADDEDDITRAIRKSSAISKRPVSQVKKVREFVRSISNDGLEGMRKSFIRCKVYLPNAATRTYFDQNQDRVRYRDVICIDQTRVILKCQPDGSDFIHASRIPIGDSPNQVCFPMHS
ncbi:unnamed protein product [Toxocara canis]|uniref:Tyrosine-protein phosphatase domain-containing protein n=1 Tax=Toxocara canis TaxID=6265 RepID=A0A183VDC8_TOXCA|nr:unnamed protein product [Toxocara canis]